MAAIMKLHKAIANNKKQEIVKNLFIQAYKDLGGSWSAIDMLGFAEQAYDNGHFDTACNLVSSAWDTIGMEN